MLIFINLLICFGLLIAYSIIISKKDEMSFFNSRAIGFIFIIILLLSSVVISFTTVKEITYLQRGLYDNNITLEGLEKVNNQFKIDDFAKSLKEK